MRYTDEYRVGLMFGDNIASGKLYKFVCKEYYLKHKQVIDNFRNTFNGSTLQVTFIQNEFVLLEGNRVTFETPACMLGACESTNMSLAVLWSMFETNRLRNKNLFIEHAELKLKQMKKNKINRETIKFAIYGNGRYTNIDLQGENTPIFNLTLTDVKRMLKGLKFNISVLDHYSRDNTLIVYNINCQLSTSRKSSTARVLTKIN